MLKPSSMSLRVFIASLVCSVLTFTWANVTRGADTAIVVYGATPAGIAAALAAAKDGHQVLLVEPTRRIGGLLTSGLSHTDLRTFESITGSFREFTERVEAHYRSTYGQDSAQVKACERGIFGEPKVNLMVLEQMLAEHPAIKILLQTHLAGVDVSTVSTAGLKQSDAPKKVIRSITLQGIDQQSQVVAAGCCIDASYEGDLMAEVGVKWRVGREGRAEFGESLAPEQPDQQLQAYNFRFIMTQEEANRVKPLAPPGYQREDFLPLVEILQSGRIDRVFGYPSKCLFKAHLPELPNRKYDINDVSGGLVRLSLPGRNLQWPSGDAETRARIFADHYRDQAGLLYFLQTDASVPKQFQDEANLWGWCKDEFEDSDHVPPQLYVREARRMVGQYVFTERDTDHAPDDARAVFRADAIAIGDYGPNCHGTGHEGPRFGGRHTGEFYKQVPPYQIPYGVLLPRDVSNLLVPGAVSSSHVGFCALRLEPIWMSLGQAAGHAAGLSIQLACPASDIPLPVLQSTLHRYGSATLYVSDVLPGHPDFALVQWWGLQGGWHGLAPQPEKPGQRGANLHGQYFAAFPNHAAQLDQPLDGTTKKRWLIITDRLNLTKTLPAADQPMRRGDFLRGLWEQAHR